MSKEVKNAATTIVPTGEVVPVAPGQEPVPRISEEHRAQLSEAWQEVRAANNAVAALRAEAGRLDAERRVAEAEIKSMTMVGQQLDMAVQQRLQMVREKYNIPDGWQIDAKTGVIMEPPKDADTVGAAASPAPVQQAQPAE